MAINITPWNPNTNPNYKTITKVPAWVVLELVNTKIKAVQTSQLPSLVIEYQK